jgi:hypothetical protein
VRGASASRRGSDIFPLEQRGQWLADGIHGGSGFLGLNRPLRCRPVGNKKPPPVYTGGGDLKVDQAPRGAPWEAATATTTIETAA